MSIKKFGFIQGRLTKPPQKKMLQYFPKKKWKLEFKLAREIGFDYIEYFGERIKNNKNPIWSNNGLKQINYLVKKNKLESYSFCDDFFINKCLITYSNIEKYFDELIKNLSFIGIKVYVIALFEKSKINKKNLSNFAGVLQKISKKLLKKKIKLALETNLDFQNLNKLLKNINCKNTFTVYDTGNRLKSGKKQYNEIIKLKKKIVHVHLKDKNYKGENVVFGNGNVDFKKIFEALSKINYQRKFTFETNRGLDPKKTMICNKKLVLDILCKLKKNNLD